MFKIKNKWIVLFGAILAQMAIGAVYSWSLFNAPIAEAYGWTTVVVYKTYSIAIFFFAFSTIFSGRLQLSKGPKITALIGALLYSGGVILSAFAKTPTMLYLSYGVIAGSGVGFVYVVPLATLVKWFPEQKGTFTGVAVATFAGGSILFKGFISSFLGNGPYTPEIISSTFIKIGLIYLVFSVIGALLLDVPETTETKKVSKSDKNDLNPSMMIKTGNFYKVTLSYLMAVMPGLLVIGLAKDIGVELVQLDGTKAAGIVIIVAIFNAAGRLISGVLADKLGSMKVLKIMMITTILSLATLGFVKLNYQIFFIAILGLVVSYGGFLAIFPTLVSSLFGSKNYSANYGLVFQGYGIAALVGPIIKENTTGYNQTFMISMIMIVFSIILISLIKKPETEF